ncbi:MAG: class I SAM-dependent methyltransferase [Parvularculaceae bacterium]
MKRISHCRACGSAALTPAFTLEGASNSAGKKGLLGRAKAEPLEFVLCDPAKDVHACGLLQNAFCVDGAIRQTAPSGIYRTTRSSLRALATEGLELISGRDCCALDIGCSDGTLLSFYPRWVDRYGVDPSDDIDQIGAWTWSAKTAFPGPETDRAFAGKKFDLITAASTLEEVEEPRAFLARIKSLLTDDGVFCLETLYAPMALTHTAADIFASGVSAVYSLTVLERLIRDCDLKVFRGGLTEKDGGSIRLFITHAHSAEYDFDPWYERLAQLWDEENALSLRSIQPYQAFAARTVDVREAYAGMIDGLSTRGDSIHLYGADAGAAMIFAWAGGRSNAIEAAVVATAFEDGARLCAGGPAIVSETESRAINPECLIAPAALKREILERWRDYVLQGGKILFVTPQPHVVHGGNYAAEFGKSLAGAEGGGGADSLRAILKAAGGLRVVGGKDGRRTA